jgi:hypothetical protein
VAEMSRVPCKVRYTVKFRLSKPPSGSHAETQYSNAGLARSRMLDEAICGAVIMQRSVKSRLSIALSMAIAAALGLSLQVKHAPGATITAPRYIMVAISLSSVAAELGIPGSYGANSLIVIEQNSGDVTECSEILNAQGLPASKCQLIGTITPTATTVTLMTTVVGPIVYILNPTTTVLFQCSGLVNSDGFPAGSCSTAMPSVPPG